MSTATLDPRAHLEHSSTFAQRLKGAPAYRPHAQRPGSRLLTPLGATDDGFANLVDAGPLYMGKTVARIDEIRPAAEIVGLLTP